LEVDSLAHGCGYSRCVLRNASRSIKASVDIGGVTFPTTPFFLHAAYNGKTIQAQLVYVDTLMELYSQDYEDTGVELPLL
jgi:hypothetical protein